MAWPYPAVRCATGYSCDLIFFGADVPAGPRPSLHHNLVAATGLTAPPPLELHNRSHAEDQRVLQRHGRHVTDRIGRAAAGMPNELDVGLQRQTAPHFVLVDRGKNSLRRSYWPCRTVQGPEIPIQSLGPWRYVRVRDGHAELVVRPSILKSNELNAAVGVVVNQILVRRRIRGASEDANSSIDVAADP